MLVMPTESSVQKQTPQTAGGAPTVKPAPLYLKPGSDSARPATLQVLFNANVEACSVVIRHLDSAGLAGLLGSCRRGINLLPFAIEGVSREVQTGLFDVFATKTGVEHVASTVSSNFEPASLDRSLAAAKGNAWMAARVRDKPVLPFDEMSVYFKRALDLLDSRKLSFADREFWASDDQASVRSTLDELCIAFRRRDCELSEKELKRLLGHVLSFVANSPVTDSEPCLGFLLKCPQSMELSPHVKSEIKKVLVLRALEHQRSPECADWLLLVARVNFQEAASESQRRLLQVAKDIVDNEQTEPETRKAVLSGLSMAADRVFPENRPTYMALISAMLEKDPCQEAFGRLDRFIDLTHGITASGAPEFRLWALGHLTQLIPGDLPAERDAKLKVRVHVSFTSALDVLSFCAAESATVQHAVLDIVEAVLHLLESLGVEGWMEGVDIAAADATVDERMKALERRAQRSSET